VAVLFIMLDVNVFLLPIYDAL